MTASLVAVATYVSAALLVAAGAVKIVRPLPTARAMYAAGLPGHTGIARSLGAVEVAAGVWFLVAPSAASGLVLAALYLSFAGFIGFLLVAHPEAASCGCGGAHDVPPSAIHLCLNLAAVLAAVAAALAPPAGLASMLTSLGLAAVPFGIGLGTAAVLAAVAVTDLPAAFAAYRRPGGHPTETDAHRHLRADDVLAVADIGPGHPSLWPGDAPTPAEPDA